MERALKTRSFGVLALAATRVERSLVNVLRNRLTALLGALAFAAGALTACGDDDGKGVAEDVEKGAKKGAEDVEKGAKKGAREVEQEGNEVDDDIKGTDEKRQEDK